MTINEHISSIRTLMKEHADDSLYQDQFIYNQLLIARSLLISREYGQGKPKDPQEFTTVCLALEKGDIADCSALVPFDLDCKILRSKLELPEIINSKMRILSNVTEISGESISRVDRSMSRYLKYSRL